MHLLLLILESSLEHYKIFKIDNNEHLLQHIFNFFLIWRYATIIALFILKLHSQGINLHFIKGAVS